MKQTKFNAALFLVALSFVIMVAATPVFAHSGGDDSVTGTSQSDDNSSDDESTSDDSSQRGRDGRENESEIKNKAAMLKRNGMQKLSLQRAKTMHGKSKLQRAKTCQNIQKAVNNKLKAFDAHADKYLARLNTLFTKVQAYQTTNSLPVANYDTLVASATQKQADATLAVAALKSMGATIDCSASDPAAMLSGAKAGAAAARDALKEYRKSLKSIVVALVQADKADTTKTEDN